jgi:hypothetical protein
MRDVITVVVVITAAAAGSPPLHRTQPSKQPAQICGMPCQQLHQASTSFVDHWLLASIHRLLPFRDGLEQEHSQGYAARAKHQKGANLQQKAPVPAIPDGLAAPWVCNSVLWFKQRAWQPQ